MEEAEGKGASFRGVKGLSPLVDMPFVGVVIAFMLDYMNCVSVVLQERFQKG